MEGGKDYNSAFELHKRGAALLLYFLLPFSRLSILETSFFTLTGMRDCIPSPPFLHVYLPTTLYNYLHLLANLSCFLAESLDIANE